jgi:hypothetical protein
MVLMSVPGDSFYCLPAIERGCHPRAFYDAFTGSARSLCSGLRFGKSHSVAPCQLALSAAAIQTLVSWNTAPPKGAA